MLNSSQAALYQRLQDFELDDPTHEFGFTRHLMKNQGWTRGYAQRAIAEYKKFAFLTVVADHQVVPSDQVDQVWHAHVLLTQSYWEEFCPKVLGKKLHHHPARGGQAERAAFHRLYAQTIASYRQFFGSPPTDIWSPPDIRFGAELKTQRVCLSKYWLIPKRWPELRLPPLRWPPFPSLQFPLPSLPLPQWRFIEPFAAVAVLAFVIAGCVSAGQASTLDGVVNDRTANPFFAVLSGAVILGLMLRYLIRRPSTQPQKPQLDIYQIAYLVGGSQRAVELAITKLVHQGYLRPNLRQRTFAIEKRLPSGASSLEQQVMRQIRLTPQLESLLRQQPPPSLRERLEQEKLLMTGWAASIGHSFGIFLLITILGGLLATVLGIQLPALSSIWAMLWQAIGIITLCCIVPSQRTRWGGRVLADIQKNHDVYDVTQRFALYGYRVLSGGALDNLKQMFKKVEEDAASGACGC